MRVYELLTMIDKKKYKLEFHQYKNKLSGGKFSQENLELNILNSEVDTYVVYPTLKTILIFLKVY